MSYFQTSATRSDAGGQVAGNGNLKFSPSSGPIVRREPTQLSLRFQAFLSVAPLVMSQAIDMGICFGNGDAHREAVNNFLSRLWRLVDNQSGLKWQIVTRQQQANVQVRGVKVGFGGFITQSLYCRNPGLSWSGLARFFFPKLSVKSMIAGKIM
jgi:hypothetical protein